MIKRELTELEQKATKRFWFGGDEDRGRFWEDIQDLIFFRAEIEDSLSNEDWWHKHVCARKLSGFAQARKSWWTFAILLAYVLAVFLFPPSEEFPPGGLLFTRVGISCMGCLFYFAWTFCALPDLSVMSRRSREFRQHPQRVELKEEEAQRRFQISEAKRLLGGDDSTLVFFQRKKYNRCCFYLESRSDRLSGKIRSLQCSFKRHRNFLVKVQEKKLRAETLSLDSSLAPLTIEQINNELGKLERKEAVLARVGRIESRVGSAVKEFEGTWFGFGKSNFSSNLERVLETKTPTPEDLSVFYEDLRVLEGFVGNEELRVKNLFISAERAEEMLARSSAGTAETNGWLTVVGGEGALSSSEEDIEGREMVLSPNVQEG